MDSLSLVNEEVKKKISRLLGKNSSLLFVCFCRVLYAKKDSKSQMSYINSIDKWKDDNLTGYFAVTITRGIVKNFPIYSALLFDYIVEYVFINEIDI